MLLELHRRMVLGRRFDRQATTLTKQGRLAVYPSSRGQDACQVGAVLALRDQDWLFPTYRDTVAILTRGVDPVEALTLLRGDWHCGYDPYQYRVAPQCTPLATNTLHAVGLAHAAPLKRRTRSRWSCSATARPARATPTRRSTSPRSGRRPWCSWCRTTATRSACRWPSRPPRPTLAAKGIGYGIPVAAHRRQRRRRRLLGGARRIERAAAGRGPTLIEAITYRIEAHTNADDATRYRADAEVQAWLARDPIARLEAYLTAEACSTSAGRRQPGGRGGAARRPDVRDRMNRDADVDPPNCSPTCTPGRRRPWSSSGRRCCSEMEDTAP